jgi:uncharacterized membrane protein YidH (DUF202 family)
MPPAEDGADHADEVPAPDRLEDIEDLDPGLAQERTILAWNRTGLSFMAVGGVVARIAPVAGSSIVVLGILVWLMGYLEQRGHGPRRLDRVTRIRLIAFGTGLVSVVAFVVALLGGGGGA